MDTPDNGSRIKRMVVDPIFIQMGKDMKEDGLRIRDKAEESIDTETVIFTMVDGKMIGGRDKGP